MSRSNRSRRGFNNNDWACGKCGYSNFGRNASCRKCGAKKGGTKQGGNSRKAGDWTCPSCNGHNFASRNQCYTCKQPKPSSNDNNSSSKQKQAVGNNSNKNNNNKSNGNSKNSNSENGISGVFSGGRYSNDKQSEWQCNNCLNFNAVDGLLCRVCNSININCKLAEARRCFETQFITSINDKNEAADDGEWLCSSCGTKNRATRRRCFNKKCNQSRSSNDNDSKDKDKSKNVNSHSNEDIEMKSSNTSEKKEKEKEKEKEKKVDDVDMENTKTIAFAKGCKATMVCVFSLSEKCERLTFCVPSLNFFCFCLCLCFVECYKNNRVMVVNLKILI